MTSIETSLVVNWAIHSGWKFLENVLFLCLNPNSLKIKKKYFGGIRVQTRKIIFKWDIFGRFPNTVKRFRIFRIERGHYRNFETVWWFTRDADIIWEGLVPRRIDGRKKGLQISFFGWVALIDFDKWSSLFYWRATRKHPLKSGKWNVDKCHGFRKEGGGSTLEIG